MPIADDLRAIIDRANHDLDAVLDFFDHSRVVWASFQDVVSSGYVVTANSSATGTVVDQNGLVRLALHYERGYLAPFTFREFVSLFELFLFDFLHGVFRHNPHPFARSQLEFDTV